MANEITVQAGLSIVSGGLNLRTNVSKQATQTNIGGVQRRQSIPTSDTVITLTGVTTPRVAHITNKDTTNYVKIGPTSGGAIVAMGRLQPGETMVVPLEPSVVLRGQANGSAVIIEILLADT